MTVGTKLVFGFSTMILFMGIIGFAGYTSVNTIQSRLNEIFSVRLPSIDFLIEADRDLQQLLVAERSMIFTGTKSDVFKSLVAEYEENLQQADTRWGKYKALSTTPEETALIAKYETAREEWKTISRKVVDGRISDTRQGRREALDLTLGGAKEKFETMRNYIDELTELNLSIAQKAHDQATATYKGTIISLLGISGVGLILGIFLMWVINRGVTKPLKRMISGLTEASDQVTTGSDQVSSSSQELAEGSSEQAASIEETSASLEEMSSMTKQNADNAKHADDLMKEANQVVEKADASMSELTHSMAEISKASEETSKIVKTIDEIAFQTNLLALNAAVEAARAGEAGAGFAVVADEVRNLAMRAADAAKNTASMIEGTVKKVTDGGSLVATTNEAFSEVAQSTGKVGELVAEIAAASKEQAEGIAQVNQAVVEMDKVVQRNAANAEESASASEEMNTQAQHLKNFVGDLVTLAGSISDRDKKQLISLGGGATQKPGKPLSRPISGKMVSGNPFNKPIVPHKTGEVNPQQVIPLDDDDFKDF
jgi:methyl-accepting chemotaxis protein